MDNQEPAPFFRAEEVLICKVMRPIAEGYEVWIFEHGIDKAPTNGILQTQKSWSAGQEVPVRIIRIDRKPRVIFVQEVWKKGTDPNVKR